MKRTIIISIFALCLPFGLKAQDTLRYTLEQCRQMALDKGTSAQMQNEAHLVADYNRQAALAAMFPKVSANAAYMWNSREAHLLANQMDFSFGTAGVSKDGSSWFEWNDGTELGKLAQEAQGTAVGDQAVSLQQTTGQAVADAYQQLYDALTVNMTHVVVAQVGITQPIYVGGRLRELYNISKSAEKIADIESESKKDDIIVSVDEAYWRVVNVEQKKRLADNYYALVSKLENDVTDLVQEGMATQSDLLKVKAKKGEAELKKMQATNGLILSKMALCQLIGLPLDSVIYLDESHLSDVMLAPAAIDADAAVSQRKEVQLLEEAEKVARSNQKIMAAGLQPNIVASAGYIYTNPYADNGLSNNWKNKGFFSAGVVVNVPIVHADDILRYKAAKHEANIVALKTEEAKEMLSLQTTQANQKLMEANQKLEQAKLNLKNSEEVLRMATESFQSGMVTVTDLMMAQTGWLSAASDKVDAEVEAHVTATYLLKYTSALR